jgi:hypothetical protein
MDDAQRKRPHRERFLTILSARRYAARHRLRVVCWTRSTRGTRLDVVSPSGKPRTLRVIDGRRNEPT